MSSPLRSTLPALRPGVAVIPMDGGVQLRLGDEEVHVLQTDAPARVLAVLAGLDGRQDRGALLARLGADEAHLLDELLAQLASARLLARGNATADVDEVARYLSHAAPEAEDPAASLRAARVSILGNGASADRLKQVIAEHGITTEVIERGAIAKADGALVCAWDAPDLALSFEVNDAACEAKLPCLFVDLSHGRHATIGPFYVPGDGACYRCFRSRLHENTAAFAEIRAAEQQMLESRAPLPAFGRLPAHRHLVAGIAAGEIVAFFARHRPLRTLNRAITVALEQVDVWSEPVWRVPWCEACC